MKKLCIFDLDGTLLDSLQDLKDSVNGILKKYGWSDNTNIEDGVTEYANWYKEAIH